MLDMQQLCKTGGIVFTNGDLDGWAGGSFQSWKELQAAIAAGFAGNARHGGKWWDAGDAAAALIAFVTYKGASHCTGAALWPCVVERHVHFNMRATRQGCWFHSASFCY